MLGVKSRTLVHTAHIPHIARRMDPLDPQDDAKQSQCAASEQQVQQQQKQRREKPFVDRPKDISLVLNHSEAKRLPYRKRSHMDMQVCTKNVQFHRIH